MKKNWLLVCLMFLPMVCAVCEGTENPRVVLETNFGDIVIELYPDSAPITVENFLYYVNSYFFNGLIFHRAETVGRITTDYYGNTYTGSLDVLQGGGFYLAGYSIRQKEPTRNSIINESDNGLSNIRGTISMARTTEPDSATSQFFINHRDNVVLDRDYPLGDGYGYCVFGSIVEGIDVMDEIAQTNLFAVYGFNGFFPYDPPAYIHTAYELPCKLSHCSDLADKGRINFVDFAILSSHWLDDCDAANGFCSGADLDYSGGVDIVDLKLFWNHWSQIAGYEDTFSDLTHDDLTGTLDLIIMMQRWLDSTCNPDNNFCDQADINRDGTVNFTDYSLLSNHWLSSLE
jgi:cyclophilin family peptidyl-prolyl cis-trans isomerase